MTVKQLKEGWEDRRKAWSMEKEGVKPFCNSKVERKYRLRICLMSSISSLQSNYTAHSSPSLFINEIHAKS